MNARRPALHSLLRVGLASLLTAAVAVGCFTVTAHAGRTQGQDELAEVRAATARFHRVAEAEQAGYRLVEGLDHCFEKPGTGGMGYHYINVDLLDQVTDPRAPEALVYAPLPNGKLQLVAVEWVVPDPAPPAQQAPTVLGEAMHYNDGLEVWAYHAWIFKHNPRGMFDDWNPRVTCPAGTD